VPVRDEARQDCDGTRPLSSGGQAPPSGQQLRPGRRRQLRADKSSAGHPSGVSHSQGHARSHQLQPGIITEPLGSLTVILGFVGYGLWQASEAVWGHRTERDDRKRTASRVESAVKAVIYLLLAVVAFRVVTGSSSGGQGGEQVTAKLLQLPGGQILVGVAGVVIVATAVLLAWRGLRTKFEEHLDLSELGPGARSAVIGLGKVGYIARGIVFALVGILVVAAAVTFDPDKARGMDAALRQVATRPYGPWLLSLMALGLMCFGAYSLAESRYRRL
jgi:hypothetical protein